MQPSKDPIEILKEAQAKRDEALLIERQAIKQALVLTAGNIDQAAVLLQVSPGMLRRIACKGGRHAELAGLVSRRRGAPPRVPEKIAKVRLPANFAEEAKKIYTQPKKAKPKAKLPKLPPLPKLKGIDPFPRTEASKAQVVAEWHAAQATGERQKDFAAKHGVGVSTLREWIGKYAKPTAPAPGTIPAE